MPDNASTGASWCPRASVNRAVTSAKIAVPAGLISAGISGLLALVIVGGALGADAAVAASPPLCVTSGPLSGLSAAQSQNARTVTALAVGRGGEQAALVAVMVGLAESQLLSLGNPTVSDAASIPVQGYGTDHDSLGIFQQRAGWGTAPQRIDPVTSTNLFMNALLADPGWRLRPAWVVAQEVQRSAFTGFPSAANHQSSVLGGNYLAQLGKASALVAEITSGSNPDCGAGMGDTPAGPHDAFGLPTGYSIPADASGPARVAVALALAQRGKPYAWGATGPDRFDCSGLVQWAWAAAGLKLSRVTQQQLRDGYPSTTATVAVGDLVLVPGSDGTLASPGHVGMYIGAGLVVHAPRTGDVVKVVTLASFTADGVSAVRHIA